ncbi:LuxR C-terminal-related transcriptional regulator [Candidatus Methylomirabilis sp.]|uniref:helix-turn-helix transcriptional regulator n=1 Tax=Candidatus Methylomirabilis sp. TaxID=2032687 RepID=UPI0030761849
MGNRANAVNVVKKTARARSPAGDSPRRIRLPEQSWAYLQSVFQESPEGICLIDASMRVVVWNRAAVQITGYEASEILGRLCYFKGNTLEVERFCQAACPIVRVGESPSGCDLCIEGKNFSTRVIPVRHEGVAFLVLILRKVPFPLQFVTSKTASSPRSAAPPGHGEPQAPSRWSALTSRECEVLWRLAAGKTAKPIATELSLSLSTVRTHIQNLLRKLEVHSCQEAVVCFFQGRLADSEPPS